jgi:hypothetical protein
MKQNAMLNYLSLPKIPSGNRFVGEGESVHHSMMLTLLHALGTFILDLFKSRRRLQAENLFLRHQLNIALRKASPRAQLRGADRALLVWMTSVFPDLLSLAKVVKPETIVRWHRGKPVVGSASDPWRAADARFRCGSVHSVQLHAATALATIAIVEDISTEPCPCNRRDRHVRGPDADI